MKKTTPIVFVCVCLFAWFAQAEVELKSPIVFFERLISSIPLNQAIIDPELSGPEKLCNVVGSVRGTFSGGGNPDTDVYKWTILAPNGQVLFTRPPGAFESIEYTFEQIGVHKVLLEVSRGGILVGNFSKNVDIIKGATITLLNSYQICSGQSLSIKAIAESSSDFSNYSFEWTDESGVIIGNSNELIVNTPGKYNVEFYVLDGQSNPQCQTNLTTTVTQLDLVTIVKSSDTVCKDGSINFKTDPLTVGQWILSVPGEPNPVFLSKSSQITLFPNINLLKFGQYELKVLIENPDNPACSPEATTTFIYNVEPFVEIIDAIGASGCFVADGSLELVALTDIDQLIVEELGLSFGPFSVGDPINIPNLESGAYTLLAFLDGCRNSFGTVVPLLTPPANLEFAVENVTGESCTETGKIGGSFEISLLNGITEGSFRIITERGDEIIKDALPNENPFKINLGGGKYFFEILDKDSCNLPRKELIEIPSKSQTNFFIPENLVICQSYDLIPDTSQDLVFTLTDPVGNITSKAKGEPFNITEEGEYILVGSLPNQDELCPSLRKIVITTTDPISFDPILKSEDCVIGNRIYTAEIYGTDSTSVNYFWRNELGETIGTGKDLFLSPNSIGIFSLEVQPKSSELCPISPKEFEVKEPILFVEATIASTKLCEFGPEAIIELSTTSPDAVKFIEWRRFDELGEIVDLPEFNNQFVFNTRIGGTYEATLFSEIKPGINSSCELARINFTLDLTPEKVFFEIPTNLSICETYEFTPITTENLLFEITKPNGEILELNSGEPITIDQNGIYSFFAYNPDLGTPLCPEVKNMEVVVNQKIQFSPELLSEDCNGEKIYIADIGGVDPALALFTWFDESGNIIGTNQLLTLNTFGDFSLDVQPSGSIPCDQEPVSFFVEPPLLSVPVSLTSEPLCPDASSTSITATSEFDLVNEIQWWFTATNGQQNQLIQETNKESILVFNEGTYEVRILNENGCLLGFDRVLIMRSMDAIRPTVEESYKVCPRYEIGPVINPGVFSGYEWYFEDQLVSTDPTYKPILPGKYELIVFSNEGCAYNALFETEEECELRVSYPNAVQPGNPDKEFLIYTNYLIDEMKVSIFNKWGEIIFYCEKKDLISEESTCFWDVTYDGKAIPNGTYAIRIDLKNIEKGLSKTQIGSILIVK
ncbi:hypothetical protein [Algoriphagus marinus]|uniref:hypothetical protein n=1 Tax=Algoriphagus marinus TaxID=1925762 RepID=UPI0011153A92|nr:hypothetical protein [Algoriphagus marinus]